MDPTHKGVIVLDTETTGTDPAHDQIIELSVQHGLADGSSCKTWRITPSVPIPPDATALHGITMDNLAHCQPFAAHTDTIRMTLGTATGGTRRCLVSA